MILFLNLLARCVSGIRRGKSAVVRYRRKQRTCLCVLVFYEYDFWIPCCLMYLRWFMWDTISGLHALFDNGALIIYCFVFSRTKGGALKKLTKIRQSWRNIISEHHWGIILCVASNFEIRVGGYALFIPKALCGFRNIKLVIDSEVETLKLRLFPQLPMGQLVLPRRSVMRQHWLSATAGHHTSLNNQHR